MKSMDSALEILNVDADVSARSRLKQLFYAHCPDANLLSVQQLKQGLAKLDLGKGFDLLIVSSDFGLDELGAFFEKVKKFSQCQDMLIVTLLRGPHCTSDAMLKNMLNGVHGSLCEPISVDELATLLEQARKSRTVREERKKLVAAEFILADAIKYVDLIAQRKAKGESYGYKMKSFRRAVSGLALLAKENQDIVSQALIKSFMAITRPRYIVRERVKEAKSEKIELEQKAPQSGPLRIVRKG